MSLRSWNYASSLSCFVKMMGSHGRFSAGDKIRLALEKWTLKEVSVKTARPVKRLLK